MAGVATKVVVRVAPGAIVSTELSTLVDTSLVTALLNRAFDVIVNDAELQELASLFVTETV